MKKHILYIVLLLCITNYVFSQENNNVLNFSLPVRNSLKFNRHVLNPAFSFVREQYKYINITNKSQWIEFDDAPRTLIANYGGRFKENIGLGVSLFQQNVGVFNTFGGLANFSYNVVLERDSNLTFGVNLAFYQNGISSGDIISNSADPVINNLESNSIVTIEPGINYGTAFFDFGLSLKNIVSYNLGASELLENNPEQGVQAHVMYTGFMDTRGFFDNSKFTSFFRSEFLQGNTILSGVLSLNVPKGIWGQVGYNTFHGASAGIGLNISQQIAMEYNYEQSFGKLIDFGSSHEITLAYRFKNKNRYIYSDDGKELGLLTGDKKRIVPKKPSTKIDKEQKSNIAEQRKSARAEALKRAQEKKEERERLLAEAKIKREAKIKAFEERKKEAREAAIAREARIKENKIAAKTQFELEQEKKRALEEANRIAQADKDAQDEEDRLRQADADEKAQAELERIRIEEEAAEQNRIIEAQRLRDEQAAEEARLAEEQRLRDEQAAEEARLAEEQRLRDEQAAEEARLAEEQRLRDEQAAEEARLAEEQRLRDEQAAEEARLAEEQRIRDEQAQALEEEARIQEQQEAAEREAEEEEERLAEEQRLQEEQDARLLKNSNATDALAESFSKIQNQANESSVLQEKLIVNLNRSVDSKQETLDELKKENDLRDQGVVSAPKRFKSTSGQNARLEDYKNRLDKVIISQDQKIAELEELYKKRLKKVRNKKDADNIIFKENIEKLKRNQQTAIASRDELRNKLENIKIATEIERNRRIKRADYDNDDERYAKDRARLENIKSSTPLASTPLTKEDFNFGERYSNTIHIIKNIKNVKSGYYLILAVHADAEKRDDFLRKAIASGQSNIDFFYDVTTSKYYIYYQKFNDAGPAQDAMTKSGRKPYNSKRVLFKVED